MFCVNWPRQKEADEKDVPYMKSNGTTETQKWQLWTSQGKDTQTDWADGLYVHSSLTGALLWFCVSSAFYFQAAEAKMTFSLKKLLELPILLMQLDNMFP